MSAMEAMTTKKTVTTTNAEGVTQTRILTVISGNNGKSTIGTSTLRSGANGAPKGASSGANPTATASGSSGAAAGSSTSSGPSASSTAAPVGGGSSSSNSGGGGVSTGAVVGAAIGCLIGGALIAFIIAYLVFKKREQRRFNAGAARNGDGYGDSSKDVMMMNERPPAKSTTAAAALGAGAGAGAGAGLGAGAAAAAYTPYLPQGADDRTIQNGVKTFFNLIELHVDNFYSNTAASLGSRERETLSHIDSGKLPVRIEKLMQEPGFVPSVIKHCIADLLIARMVPSASRPERSLLPAHLASEPGKLQSASSLSSGERSALSQAYSQYRTLSTYLFPNPQEDPSYIDAREAQATSIASLLASSLAPWRMNPSSDDKNELMTREKGLVATAGNLGVLLQSQPSGYEFRWAADGRSTAGTGPGGRSLVVLPGFWKSTDEVGRGLSAPMLLVSPEIQRV